MDQVTRDIQCEIPWCMLFADDVALIGESRTEVEKKLELWRQSLESKGFRLSRTKNEYLRCDFDDPRPYVRDVLNGYLNTFKYLGSMIQRDGGIEEDIRHRTQAGWEKWRLAKGVSCDRKVPLKLKGKFYKTTIRPVMLYGAENEYVRKKLKVSSIKDMLSQHRLRWFGHLRRRPPNAPVRVGRILRREGRMKRRGRPKLTWDESVKHDLKKRHLAKEDPLDRQKWRVAIHVKEIFRAQRARLKQLIPGARARAVLKAWMACSTGDGSSLMENTCWRMSGVWSSVLVGSRSTRRQQARLPLQHLP
ncbi:uncharacterized protein LOC113291508 [Papaver somniferum]|uniref:uncharacterized protein LOC113291508 n=1 Tax=Papaver somniferum TaxID=3469 RepID=UPI000E6FC4E6|nr:uncharacterized protein LOC113291508 [Papaver somniferum]